MRDMRDKSKKNISPNNVFKKSNTSLVLMTKKRNEELIAVHILFFTLKITKKT